MSEDIHIALLESRTATRLSWRTEVLLLATRAFAQDRGTPHGNHRVIRHGLLSNLGRDKAETSSIESPIMHFDRYLVLSSGLFDAEFYCATNEDVVRAGLDPLQHFLAYGALEGRRPGPLFETSRYFESYGDVKEAGVNPLVHFIRHGIVEGRGAGLLGDLPRPVPVAPSLGPSSDWVTAAAELADLVPGSPFDALNNLERILRSAALTSAHEHETSVAAASRLASQLEEARLELQSTVGALQRAVSRNDELMREAADGQLADETRSREMQTLAARLDKVQLERHEFQEAANVHADNAKNLADRLEETNAQLSVANSSLQRAISRNDQITVAFETERLSWHERAATWQAKSEELKAAAESATNRIDIAEREREQARAEAQRFRGEAATWQAKSEELKAAAESATNRIDIAEREREQARAEAQRFRGEVAAQAGRVSKLQAELGLLQEEAERLRLEERRLAQTRAELDDMRLRIAGLEREVVRGQEHEAALIASRAEIAVLTERTAVARRELEAARAEAPVLAQVAEELKRGLGTVASAQTVATQLIDVRDRLASRLEILTSEVEDVRRGGEKGQLGRSAAVCRRLYLDLLEAALTGVLVRDGNMSWGPEEFDPELRMYGRDRPKLSKTMIGTARMRNLRRLVEKALRDGVEGDLLEAGVWRGGACIYMRGILAAHGIRNRTVWVADSFAGLPPPDAKRYPADRDDPHHTFKDLVVPLEEVKQNFEQFGLLDNQVAFLPGWFKDTLPGAPVERLAVLRLDGDMYGSTIETLEALYPRVARGGFVIIDDYLLPACRKAVDDFREQRRLTDPLIDVDGAAAYWRRERV